MSDLHCGISEGPYKELLMALGVGVLPGRRKLSMGGGGQGGRAYWVWVCSDERSEGLTSAIL